MQSLLGPAKLEGLLKSPSDVLAQRDLEPASPFANMNAVASFWKGERRVLDKVLRSQPQLKSHSSVCMACTMHAEFELDSFRQKMDEQGMAVAENQESSLKSRRRLAETTRGDG